MKKKLTPLRRVSDSETQNNFTDVETWASTLCTDLDTELATFALHTDMDAAENRLNIVEPKVTLLEGQMATAQTDINNAEGDIITLESANASNASRLSTIESKYVHLTDASQTYAYDDVLMLESNLSAPGTGTAPSRTSWGNLSLWEFPNTANRYLQSAVQLPHTYSPNTPLSFHVHFVPQAQLTAGQTVIWGIEVQWASIGAVFPSTATYTSTYTAPSTVAAYTHCMSTSVTISPSSLNYSGFLVARIWRDVADTSTAAVWLLGADYHIRKDRFGTT